MKLLYLFGIVFCLFSCSLEVPSDLPCFDKELSIEASKLDATSSQIKLFVDDTKYEFPLNKSEVFYSYKSVVTEISAGYIYTLKDVLHFGISLPDDGLSLGMYSPFLGASTGVFFKSDLREYHSSSFQPHKTGIAQEGDVLKMIIKGVLYDYSYEEYESEKLEALYDPFNERPNQEAWYQNGLPPDSAMPYPFEIQIIAKDYESKK